MKTFVITQFTLASAHYLLTLPTSRHGGNVNDPDAYDQSFWFNNHMAVDDAVLDENELRTEVGWYNPTAPWRAPGYAELWSPCGYFCRGNGAGCDSPDDDGNRDGRDLPVREKVTWPAGSIQEVAFGINTNHGGGYSYRLCAADSDLTEACFGQGALKFHGDTSWVQRYNDTTSRQAIPAKRTDKGKYGSQWTMTPVPMYDSGEGEPFKEYISGLHGQESDSDAPMLKTVSFVDKVQVPSSLSPGHYVLSFRMDCEETQEVWAQCSDVEVTTGTPSPEPVPPPSPSPSSGYCCWWPEHLDPSDCGSCGEKHYDIAEEDCYNENTYCHEIGQMKVV